jgi:NADH-quinone oxidoreductase subunit J
VSPDGGLSITGSVLAMAVGCAAASLWLLLPRGESGARELASRRAGMLLAAVALSLFIATGHRLGGVGEEATFLVVSLVAVIGGAATIVTRSPVYSAIWFALALAGVAGVLLVLGAQFLGVATIVVYAGAILVMFLFVLMLAQPSGMASYDRVSNEPLLSAVAGAVLLGLLTLFIGRLSAGPADCCAVPSKAAALASQLPANGMNGNPAATSSQQGVEPSLEPNPAAGTAEPGSRPTWPGTAPTPPDPLAADHVARLGGELFGRHLLAVEAAGVLLLVALIGSIAIVSRTPPEERPAAQPRRVLA